MPALLDAGGDGALPADARRDCYDALSRPDSFGGLPLNQIFRSGADLGPLVAAIDANDPENLRIRTPVRVEQGAADGTVFKTFTDQLVDEYEAGGAKVTYKVYPGVSHGGVVEAGAADATQVDPRPVQEVGSGAALLRA